MEEILWQTLCSCDSLYTSFSWQRTTLSRLCIVVLVYFQTQIFLATTWKISDVEHVSHKLDVQVANISVSRFYRIGSYFFGSWFANGWNPALDLRDAVIKVLHSSKTTHQAVRDDHCQVEKVEDHVPRSRACNEIWSSNQNTISKRTSNREVGELSNVDHNVTSEELFQFVAQLYIFEENEAVIKMIIEGRGPTMRHVSRT